MDKLIDAARSQAAAEFAGDQRILLVDDEPRIRAAYSQLLAADNRIIREASTGGEALYFLEKGDIDLVVLDLGLPDMSGIRVMERMQEMQLNTTVIVFSANDNIESAILALRRGAYEFIRKPCEPEELMQTVENALEKRYLKRSHLLLSARIEQSERLHRFLVDHSPDIIYTLDQDGRFVFMNSRAESLLGFERRELIGQHYSLIIHDDDMDRARYGFNERRIGDRATNNMEVRLRCKEEGFRHFENHSVVVMLSALGIYESSPESRDAGNRFLGTYGVARDITERKKAEEVISFQAYHDLLTHLPNRALLKDRLTQALTQAKRENGRVAVMYIDLDRFKTVNDTYGHAVGDELLKSFAQRLRLCLRASDTLSRHGGDEFIVVLPDIASAADTEMVATKMLKSLEQPFNLLGREFNSTVSMGIAYYPENDDTPEGLIRKADIAMYQVKMRGKNSFQAYLPEMSASHDRRIAFESDLRDALKLEQFEVYYQPQINTQSGRMMGVEALIRWHHPEKGLMAPGEFISVAEEIGLISEISDWVLAQSCAQIAQWREMGFDNLKLAINISPNEFNYDNLVERLVTPAQEYGIPPYGLEIEITENLLLEDTEKVINKVRDLRKQSLRVAVDDFGTRYSSLNYLRRFAISGLKIDKSFVRDITGDNGSLSIVHAILGIARGLGLQVLAEGVETEEQVDILRSLGCYDMQGYYFSKPVPAPQILKILSEGLPSSAAENLE